MKTHVEHQLDVACQQSNELFIGLSGGIDSVVLLFLVHQWHHSNPSVKIQAVHVNHGLSENAQAWQNHVEALCHSLNINLLCAPITIERKARQSLEALAREQRYDAFFELMPNNSVLLLGHHLNDQVETVFLRLFRGSGPKGLSAMKAISKDVRSEKSITIIRPLLSVTRESIEQYAHAHELTWIEDESNESMQFDRNVIRHQLLEPLRKVWPTRFNGLLKSISRSASLCAQQQQALDVLLDERITQISFGKFTLCKRHFLAQPDVIHGELLRYWLSKTSFVLPSEAILKEILKATHAEHDRQPCIKWADREIRMHGDYIMLLRQPYKFADIREVVEQKLTIPVFTSYMASQHLVVEKQDEALLIRLKDDETGTEVTSEVRIDRREQIVIYNNLSNERFSPNKTGKSKTLSQWFKEWKIPAWHRKSVLGIANGDTIAAVILDDEIITNESS